MIEPLRFSAEYAQPFPVDRPVFCNNCLFNPLTKLDPNVATMHCAECPRRFLCKTCDEEAHLPWTHELSKRVPTSAQRQHPE